MSNRLAALTLTLLFVISSASLILSETAEFDQGLDATIDVPESQLTPQQKTSLAGAKVSTGNWLHHVGGIGSDQGFISRIDTNGDLFVAGNVCHGAGTCSAIFGSTTIYANNDIFVAKLATNGTWLWIAQSSGTNSNSYAYLTDMELDSFGNVFISGYFRYTKTFGTISVSPSQNSGNYDGLAARLSSGGSWGWVRTMNNYDTGYARGIAVDSNQNVYVVGESYLYDSSSTYRYTYFEGNTVRALCNWRYTPWLVKYDGAGSYQWVDRLASNCYNRYMKDVITDSNDSVIVTGYFDNSLTFSSMSTSSSGSWDIFLAKVDSSHSWQWLTHGGGLSSDQPAKLAIDSNDDIYVVGWNDNHASYGTTIILANNGGFVVKALGNGSWEWGTRLSPTYQVKDIAVHSNHNLTVVGDRYITHLNSTGAQQWYESKSQYFYSLTLDANETSYITGYFSGSQWYENNYLVSNGSNDLFVWKWDRDRDGDSIADRLDNCGDNYNSNQDDYDGDGPGDACDADDDNDGFLDVADNCPRGDMNWTSNFTTDRDNDGCQDAGEDLDDDDDGVVDISDSCHPSGMLNWTSNGATDHDTDGCHDEFEDSDDDNDGITDSLDQCELGDLNWQSNSTTDHDSDGCNDSNEDQDDDNDGVFDGIDSCPSGDTGWLSDSSSDHDSDGCQDLLEDLDDDGDSALDVDDICPRGVLDWIRYVSADYDDDGCRDSDEDSDDDNDAVTDHADLCYLGQRNWTSTNLTDNDADGCRDSDEDNDDDNDGITDVNDFCPQGDIGWTSGRVTDHDSDGCKDDSEDMDDDGDGINDGDDSCPKGMLGWNSNGGSDYDGDGCLDATEDGDDDGDGVTDYADPCPYGEENCGATGSGGNVTIIHQYPDNSSANESSPVTSTVIHYHNNSTTIIHYHNNSTTINPLDNSTVEEPPVTPPDETEQVTDSETAVDEGGFASSSLMDAVSTISLLLIAIFVLILMLGQFKSKPSHSEFADDHLDESGSAFEFSQTAEVEAALQEADESEIDSDLEEAEEVTDEVESSTPSVDLVGVWSHDGNEWIEHPIGSGQHWYRPESGTEWQFWDS